MEVIDGKEYYTVKEAADIWKVSPQTAYKRIQRSGHVNGHTTHVQNKLYVDAAIISMFTAQTDGRDKSGKNTKMSETSETSPTTVTDALVGLLRDQLEAKDAEIERLHAEIDKLHGDVDKLHTLLDQSHQLLAMRDTKELSEPPQKRRRWRGR